MCGVLVVDKAAGPTSFDVVAAVRKALGETRVGHTGTLDPFATGVLPICVGQATVLSPYIVDDDKEYVATVRLGVETDSGDRTGRVLRDAPPPMLTAPAVEAELAAFVGWTQQTPPKLSAIKVAGRRAYDYVRTGEELVMQPRPVFVAEVQLVELVAPFATVRIVCGKGFYVRSFAMDLGARLGCGASLEALRRTRVGPFDLHMAVPAGMLTREQRPDLESRLVSPEQALLALPTLHLDEGQTLRVRQGKVIAPDEFPNAADGPFRALGPDGRLVAILKSAEDGIRVARGFADPRPALDAANDGPAAEISGGELG
jgi:tRNA pseudouridine55 synthase